MYSFIVLFFIFRCIKQRGAYEVVKSVLWLQRTQHWGVVWPSVLRQSLTKPRSRPSPRKSSTPMQRMLSSLKPSLSLSTTTGWSSSSSRGLSRSPIILLCLLHILVYSGLSASLLCWYEPATSWASFCSTGKQTWDTWLWRACARWPAQSFLTKP